MLWSCVHKTRDRRAVGVAQALIRRCLIQFRNSECGVKFSVVSSDATWDGFGFSLTSRLLLVGNALVYRRCRVSA